MLKQHTSTQTSIVTRDNTADALDFYVENARSITYHIAKIDPNPSPNPKITPNSLLDSKFREKHSCEHLNYIFYCVVVCQDEVYHPTTLFEVSG